MPLLKRVGTSPPQDYVYSSLSKRQIRTLHLRPGTLGSPLRATLERVSLDTIDYEYEAISYTWGEHVSREVIDITDHGRLPITASLHAALQQFRHPSRTRVLWVDAVCINQEDDAERSSQILMMAGIYHKASRVLVWLGPSEETDALAFTTMSAFAQVPPSVMEGFPRRWDKLLTFVDDAMSVTTHCSCCGTALGLQDDPAVLGLLCIGHLLQRPWFSRLWVIQEVLSAEPKHVQIFSGSHSASWDHLQSASMLLGAMYEAQSSRLRLVKGSETAVAQLRSRIADMLETFETRPKNFDPTAALEMIVAVWNRSCQDPRDRVLALYDLLHLSSVLEPNYEDTPGEVYRRFWLALLGGEDAQWKPWTLFCLVGTEDEESALDPDTKARPSWVPDLHHLTEKSREKLGWYNDAKNYDQAPFRASPRLFKYRLTPHDPGIIQVKGKCFATVTAILPDSAWPERSWVEGESFGTLDISGVVAWYCRCRDFTRAILAQDGPKTVDEGLVALLTCNYVAEVLPSRYAPEIEELERQLGLIWEGDIESFDAAMQHFLPFLAEQPVLSKDKIDRDSFVCLMRAPDGREDVGWVSRIARVGDQQCIFAGGPYTNVVREVDNGCFQLLGDAYAADFTLHQALGGQSKEVREHYSFNNVWYRDWNSDEPEMLRLIEDVGWMSLK